MKTQKYFTSPMHLSVIIIDRYNIINEIFLISDLILNRFPWFITLPECHQGTRWQSDERVSNRMREVLWRRKRAGQTVSSSSSSSYKAEAQSSESYSATVFYGSGYKPVLLQDPDFTIDIMWYPNTMKLFIIMYYYY